MPVTIGGSGPITGVTSINTTVSDTELGYLDGVTSALQTQLAGKADTTGNGAWTAWTPTVTAATGTITSSTVNTAAYVQLGKIVHIRFDISITTAGTGSGALKVTVPVAPRSVEQYNCVGREYSQTGFMVCGGFEPAGTGTLHIRKYDNTTIISSGYRIIAGMTYEAA